MTRSTREGLAQAAAELRVFRDAAATKPEAVLHLEEEVGVLERAAAILGRREQLLEQVLRKFPNLVPDASPPVASPPV